MQKLYIPWSFEARFTTGKIYFLGTKPYLLKTNVLQGCLSEFSNCEFLHITNVNTLPCFCNCGAGRGCGECWWYPPRSLTISGPLPWLLCSCFYHPAGLTLFRAHPLGSWSHFAHFAESSKCLGAHTSP